VTRAATELIHPWHQHEGVAVVSAAEAILKGVLEGEAVVHRVLLTDSRSTVRMQQALVRPDVRDLLRRHRLVCRVAGDAGRVIELGRWSATEGRHVVVIVGGPTVTAGIQMLERIGSFGGAESMALVMELSESSAECRPRIAAAGLPILEASCVASLRDSVEHGLRISRGANAPCVIAATPEIMQSDSSLTLYPNRMGDQAPAGLPRRRSPRWDEVGGALRIARRLELNSPRAMPSPGERAELGFVTVGMADRALRRLETLLGVERRLPTLYMRMTTPVDEAAIERLLLRCRSVVVLEPPGQLVELALVRIAQRMAQKGMEPALVLGQALIHSAEAMHMLHPSPMARILSPLIQKIITGPSLESRLAEALPRLPLHLPPDRFGDSAHAEELRALLIGMIDAEEDGGEEEEPADQPGQAEHPIRWNIQGKWVGPAEGVTVNAEFWGAARFRRSGAAAVRQASAEGTAWLLVIAAGPPPQGRELERLVGGLVPADRASHVRVLRRSGRAPAEIQRSMREAASAEGLTVLIVEDELPTRFDVAAMEHALAAIDRIGYQHTRRIAWPADRACVIREPLDLRQRELRMVDEAIAEGTTVSVEPISLRWPPRIGGRVHPLAEQVEVVRPRPPTRGLRGDEVPGTPSFEHATQPVWSAHLAGFRGDAPGLAAAALEQAAVVMGYHVEVGCDSTPIGPGRRSAAQVVFCRPRNEVERTAVPPVIPWGEADLLLGFDRGAVLAAVDPDGPFRVASPSRTSIFANTGLFEDELDRIDDQEEAAEVIHDHLKKGGSHQAVLTSDLTGVCRFRFHNERLSDFVLLGLAWQAGRIPLSLDAMHRGIQNVEARGWARLAEAFEYGRSAWLDPDRLLRPQERASEPGLRSVRRYRLILAKARLFGRDRAGRFRQVAGRVLDEVPGLLETAAGREAHRDFIVALRRCVTWGGFEMAERFAGRIISLYQVDRADTGRALTRAAILPLAETLLIRDAIYVASMAISTEHRRQTQQRLNVRRGRGDRISVRYLTRLECIFIRWRFRLDLRTSDWMAHVLAAARHLHPKALRGRRSQRQVRALVSEVVMQATSAPDDDYGSWRAVLEMLHAMALDGRLRRISPASLRREIRRLRPDG